VIADGRGMAVAFALAPGQAHESRQVLALLACMPRPALWSVADRGYASHAFRQLIQDRGSRPAIPAKTSDRKPVSCPDWIYNNRTIVERLWGRLKEWRAVATRYEKTAASFLGIFSLAATMLWIRG